MTRVDQDLAYVAAGTELFESAVARLDDAALAGPSGLPGWTRSHVVGHVARNADALVNLVNWAATGVETPMYPSMAERNAGIEASAAQPPDALRADLLTANRRLAAAVDALPAERWSAPLRNARAEPIPASRVPWMRVCELWIHGVDLDAGIGFADWPPELVRTVLDDVAPAFGQRDGVPDVVLAATDSDFTCRLGSGAEAATVAGTQADLAAYLLGRPVRGRLTGPAPELPAWL